MVGAIIATTAVVLPSFIIMLLITVLLKSVLKQNYVQAILKGLKPCVIGIVLAIGIYMIAKNCLIMGRSINLDILSLVITLVLAIIMVVHKCIFKKKISPIMLIASSAVVGMIVYAV